MVTEFHINQFTEADLEAAFRLAQKYQAGRRYTRADKTFDRWFSEEAQQQFQAREQLKTDGWQIIKNDALTIDERIRGAEMVIYSHWHRACSCCKPPIGLLEYASCWVEANGLTLLEDDRLVASLRQRYPLVGGRRLKPGYTYVWADAISIGGQTNANPA